MAGSFQQGSSSELGHSSQQAGIEVPVQKFVEPRLVQLVGTEVEYDAFCILDDWYRI
jgi:hypothetical protein